MFKYHAGNTDVRFYWWPTRPGIKLTEEDQAILDMGCIPMVDQERKIWMDGPQATDHHVTKRWLQLFVPPHMRKEITREID